MLLKYCQILLLMVLYSGIFNLCYKLRNFLFYSGMPSASLVQALSMSLQASREAINPRCFTPLQYLYTDMPLSYGIQKVIHPSVLDSLAASRFFCMHDKQ